MSIECVSATTLVSIAISAARPVTSTPWDGALDGRWSWGRRVPPRGARRAGRDRHRQRRADLQLFPSSTTPAGSPRTAPPASGSRAPARRRQGSPRRWQVRRRRRRPPRRCTRPRAPSPPRPRPPGCRAATDARSCPRDGLLPCGWVAEPHPAGQVGSGATPVPPGWRPPLRPPSRAPSGHCPERGAPGPRPGPWRSRGATSSAPPRPAARAYPRSFSGRRTPRSVPQSYSQEERDTRPALVPDTVAIRSGDLALLRRAPPLRPPGREPPARMGARLADERGEEAVGPDAVVQ